MIRKQDLSIRFESFGGIIACNEPPFLAYVDRSYMRELGLADSPLWQQAEHVGALTAPVEVHLSCTNRCSQGCPHCYMAAGEPHPRELSTDGLRDALRQLAAMGVFHVALGGGEALERPDLFEIAAYVRELGMVPNLTTSGMVMNADIAKQLVVFGQVNLSLDGIGAYARALRTQCDPELVDRAFDHLLAAGVRCGINCTIGRDNVDGLPDLFAYADHKGLVEIELLRLKPAGRALAQWDAQRLRPEQTCHFMSLIQDLAARSSCACKIDCSFVPLLCACDPPPELLEQLAIAGCEAGNTLLGCDSSGMVSGCSFLPGLAIDIRQLADHWQDPQLAALRARAERLGEPCCSCPYLQQCRGGCIAVARAVHGDANHPDPECPRVLAMAAT